MTKKGKKKVVVKESPPFVTSDVKEDDWDSDTEEFNTVNHYVEVRDCDLEQPTYSVPDGVGGTKASLTSWFMTQLFQELDRAETSECYKRCTMWKLTRRFQRLKHMDVKFFDIMNAVCPYNEGEGLGGWLKRCAFGWQETFLDLSVLHYIHCLSKKGLDMSRGSIPHQVMALYDECQQALPKLVDLHILNLVHQELSEQKSEVTELSPLVQEKLNNAFRIFVKPLYRFKLLHHLSCEKDQRKYMVLVKYGYKKKQVFNYFGTPNYFRKPVKGPFRTGVPRTSKLPRLYGTVTNPAPNPEYYYCECKSGFCGHMPLRLEAKGRVKVAHDFSFRHKF